MSIIRGKVFVLGDNIDTDQILTAEFMKLDPSNPVDYKKLGSLAMCGLPEGYPKFVGEGGKTEYVIVIGGKNFGCGSSREHAPKALEAAGVKAIVAESFARIFFRNCVSTGGLLPCESTERICDSFKTGDEAEIDLANGQVVDVKRNRFYKLRPLGQVSSVIEAGGLFAFARKEGVIK